MKIDITIPETRHSVRLDSYLSGMIGCCSRKRAAGLILEKKILVNNLPKKPGYRLKTDDTIQGIVDVPETGSDPVPEKADLDIRFDDEHILVLNKKAGMVVHPAPGSRSGTLVNALLFFYPEILNVCEDPLRPGIVHRLDKDTSGLMVVAKTGQSLDFLQKEFKQHRVEKRYLALVYGRMTPRNGYIDLPVGRHPVKRKQMSVNHETGKPAVSHWTIKKRFGNSTLVEVLLETGRTHQIRVHFYAVNHPLIGDPTYQFRRYRKKKQLAGRQMLHAGCLAFRHPYSGKKMVFQSDPPDDFKRTMARLEADSK